LVQACIKNKKRTAASRSITLLQKKQGRQPKKWMDNVNEDMEAKKLTVQQAMVPVWDRNKWKHQAAASSSLKGWNRAEEKKK